MNRTDVWAIGCLLFAWWFGYSPFECEFHGGILKVVECSSLRVLSPIPRSSCPSTDDKTVTELTEWILEKDFRVRPFTSDVMHRVEEIIATLSRGNKRNSSNSPHSDKYNNMV